MLYPTTGARLYIADLPTETPCPVPDVAWVEIGETEALGTLGVEWETTEASTVGCGDSGVIVQAKQARRALPMQILMGHDPEDEGQQVLRRAAMAHGYYPFRLVLAAGAGSRTWFAIVTALSDVFDSANSVVKLQADLIPHHEPVEIS